MLLIHFSQYPLSSLLPNTYVFLYICLAQGMKIFALLNLDDCSRRCSDQNGEGKKIWMAFHGGIGGISLK